MLLSQEKDTAQYLASMESAYRNTEEQLFSNITTTGYARSSVLGYPVDTTITNPNDSVMRLDGNGPKLGPGIVLKVMSGDKVDIAVQYYYINMTDTSSSTLHVSDILGSLATGILSMAGPTHGSFAALDNPSTSPLAGAMTSFITNNNPVVSGKPQAYLNWVLLDNQFNYVSSYPQSGALQVATPGTQGGGQLQTPLGYTGIPVTKSGYLYIYLSNGTPNWDVFFDNLSIKHYSGPLVEENHFYPFGLSMAGISDKAIKTNYAENKYRFNKGSELQNKEFSDGSGLEMYETHLRELDPQLGRWWQIDSKPVYAQSLYASMSNNPVLNEDPYGDTLRHTFRNGFLGIFGKKTSVDYNNGKFYNAGTNVEYTGKMHNFEKNMLNNFTTLSNNPVSADLMSNLSNSSSIINVVSGNEDKFDPVADNNGQYSLSLSGNLVDPVYNQNGSKMSIPGVIAAAHELFHGYDRINNGLTNFFARNRWYTSYINNANGQPIARSEIFATNFENKLRESMGLPLREYYGADKQSGTFDGRILVYRIFNFAT